MNLDLEFYYTPVTELCRSQLGIDTFCHRDRAHNNPTKNDPVHATGWGSGRVHWKNSEEGLDTPPEVW